LYRNVCDETGTGAPSSERVRELVQVRDRDGIDTTLEPGDVVTILAGQSREAEIWRIESFSPLAPGRRFRRRRLQGRGAASHCAGLRSRRPVYSTLIDTRNDRYARNTGLYASSCNPFFGMKVLRSTGYGQEFKETKSAPAFSKDDGRALANIWSLCPRRQEGAIVRRGAGVFIPQP